MTDTDRIEALEHNVVLLKELGMNLNKKCDLTHEFVVRLADELQGLLDKLTSLSENLTDDE